MLRKAVFCLHPACPPGPPLLPVPLLVLSGLHLYQGKAQADLSAAACPGLECPPGRECPPGLECLPWGECPPGLECPPRGECRLGVRHLLIGDYFCLTAPADSQLPVFLELSVPGIRFLVLFCFCCWIPCSGDMSNTGRTPVWGHSH